MNAPCLADDCGGGRYAQPEGEDWYGTQYAARQVPSSVTEVLDEQGHYTIPWFVDLTIFDNQQECWVVAQNPPGGTVVTGPQTVTVCLQYTCGNNEEEYASLLIELKDITPPEVTVIADSTSNPHLSFGGVVRYLTPVVVAPIVTVSDSCDANPGKQITLDGQPYQLGMTVSSVGLHFLNAQVTDASGNSKQLSSVFEVRERPSHPAAAVVESTSCVFSPDGMTGTLHATLLLSAVTFDHLQILPSSVRVLLRNADGTYASTSPVAIKGGIVPGCDIFKDESALMQINLCRIRFEIETQFPAQTPNQPPAQFVIVGAAVSNGALTVEWGAATPNIADATPEQTLLALVNKAAPCGTPQPPPPPPPACTRVETIITSPGTCSDPWTAGAAPCASGGAGSSTDCLMHATGNSTSVAGAPGWGTCSTSSACPPFTGQPTPLTTGRYMFVEQMVGSCCDCMFTISANASVTVTAQAGGSAIGYGSFTAFAQATGAVALDSPCGSADTNYVVATASESDAGSTGPNPDMNMGYIPLNCVHYSCTSFLIVSTGARVSTEATATHLASGAFAYSSVDSTAHVNINGTATVGPCDPCDP